MTESEKNTCLKKMRDELTNFQIHHLRWEFDHLTVVIIVNGELKKRNFY